jgi:hypothetical protein
MFVSGSEKYKIRVFFCPKSAVADVENTLSDA